jgi:hypothetical protein
MKFHRSIEIEATPEAVWPRLVEADNILKWCSPISNLKSTSGNTSGLGTTFYFEEKVLGHRMRLNFMVREWAENQRVSFRMTSGDFVKSYEQKYTIDVTPYGCEVTCFEEVQLPYGIIGIIAGLIRSFTSKSLVDQMLLNLKSLAES